MPPRLVPPPRIVTDISSPNFDPSRFGGKITMIVKHITAGGFYGSLANLRDPKPGNPGHRVSANALIDRDGTLYYLVDADMTAWANGIGYQSDLSIREIAEHQGQWNEWSYSIEHVGDGDGIITEKQFNTSLWLDYQIVQWTKQLYGNDLSLDNQHVIGHHQIYALHICPGPQFPMERFYAAYRGEGYQQTPTPTKEVTEVSITPGDFIRTPVDAATTKRRDLPEETTNEYNLFVEGVSSPLGAITMFNGSDDQTVQITAVRYMQEAGHNYTLTVFASPDGRVTDERINDKARLGPRECGYLGIPQGYHGNLTIYTSGPPLTYCTKRELYKAVG